MTKTRPAAPQHNDVRTYYANPRVDRITGRYTVEWETPDGVERIRVHNRLTDLEGHAPSIASLMRLPQVAATFAESKRGPILERPLPFLVFDAIAHLERLVGPGTRVLEIGGGNSTLWFLERGAQVTTIEHSSEWAAAVSEAAGPESALDLRVAAGDAAYAEIAALEDGAFDLLLIDCMNAFTWRRRCVELGRSKVSRGGTICLDNSDHPQNWAAVDALGRDERLRFTGYAPMCAVVTQTSFWRVD